MVLTILQKLKVFQYDNGLTVKQLAEELGVSRVHLSFILNGTRNLSDKFINRIEILFREHEATEFLDKEGRL